MASGLRSITANTTQAENMVFHSGEVDFVTLDWRYRLSADKISANGSVPLYNWYLPVGLTAFLSGTAAGSSAMWMKVSATGAPNVYRGSARITTDSAKSLIEWFDIRIWTGNS
jgi:hypothetical protein